MTESIFYYIVISNSIYSSTITIGIILFPFCFIYLVKKLLKSIVLDTLELWYTYSNNIIELDTKKTKLKLAEQKGRMMIIEHRKLLQAGISQQWQAGKFDIELE